jgi:two-component system phosphate regulon sensor histidine kinase PhoR
MTILKDKNPSPAKVIWMTAALIGLIVIISLLITSYIYGIKDNLIYIVCSGIIIIILVYWILRYILEYYIFRNVKIIYKNIQDSKIGNKEFNSNKPIFYQIQLDVKNWADQKEKEIEKLKLLENYRKEFIGDVSHELKTPIFAIQSYISTILDDNFNDLDTAKEFLMKADRNAERLANIVDDLFDIHAIEEGQMVIKWQVFNINVLVHEVFEIMEVMAQKQNIKLSIKEGCDKKFMVHADREKIRKVLINLIHNAIKYNHPNGQVRVGFYTMYKELLIEITDDGIGIDKEHISRLFERFYRTDKARTRATGGNGLGLAICKHIVEAHNQHIHCRSKLTKGSTFGFTLQLATG